MDIRTQAALLAALAMLALAISALLRDNRARVFTLFSLFSFDLFLYSLGVFLLRLPGAAGVGPGRVWGPAFLLFGLILTFYREA